MGSEPTAESIVVSDSTPRISPKFIDILREYHLMG
jgi:hypothetical protein